MTTNFFLFHLCLLFLLSCAAQAPASGGPTDKDGPILISMHPKNESVNIRSDQKITLTFNEPINPVSIPSSISLSANYKLNIKSRKIIILPDKIWPKNQIINIKISRKVRDYQNNFMTDQIQLAYSTGTNIPDGNITGTIAGYSPEKIIEVGLYDWPIHDSSIVIKKVETNKDGFFNFDFIDYGKYTLGAIQGVLNDFDKQIYRNHYSMLTKDYISLYSENSSQHVRMFLSEPLEKLEITSVEMKGQYHANLIMNNLSQEVFIIDSLYDPGDSIKINLVKTNRLEKYALPKYSFILPEVIDTIGPKLEQSEFNYDSLKLIFSEPVILGNKSIIIERDSVDVPYYFKIENSFTILLNDIDDTISQIKLLGDYIQDWDGNLMTDSIKLVPFHRSIKEDDIIIGGNVLGIVEYSGSNSLVIQARNIENNFIYNTQTENLEFKLSNLQTGIYELWAFENLHKTDSLTYFSGIWSPYYRAARFALYSDSVDVRARWDIEGIIIDFK